MNQSQFIASTSRVQKNKVVHRHAQIPVILEKMSTPQVQQVVHHIDYRSKAEDRKRELKKLQEKGLAKTKGKLRENYIITHCMNLFAIY